VAGYQDCTIYQIGAHDGREAVCSGFDQRANNFCTGDKGGARLHRSGKPSGSTVRFGHDLVFVEHLEDAVAAFAAKALRPAKRRQRKVVDLDR
jgi:hypothetical protein